ncbi:MAG: alkyl sulfatase C-terminal domain-containing protein, partial [Pseudomonadota bacterium]
ALIHRHQGFREESGIMRNVYLVGAKELEDGLTPLPGAGGRIADLAATLTAEDWFDAFALRLNPEKAKGLTLVIDFVIGGQEVSVAVARQTEFARVDAACPDPDARVAISQSALERLAAGESTLDAAMAEGAKIDGDAGAVARWLELHDPFDLWFNVVTP